MKQQPDASIPRERHVLRMTIRALSLLRRPGLLQASENCDKLSFEAYYG
jgi:hypothetical protein